MNNKMIDFNNYTYNFIEMNIHNHIKFNYFKLTVKIL